MGHIRVEGDIWTIANFRHLKNTFDFSQLYEDEMDSDFF